MNSVKSIKTVHIEKDNEIDSLTCSVCGANLKHAMIINGEVYGLDCGAKFLGWITTKKSVINRAVYNMEIARSAFLSILSSNFHVSYKRRDAETVARLYNLKIARTLPDVEYIAQVYAIVK